MLNSNVRTVINLVQRGGGDGAGAGDGAGSGGFHGGGRLFNSPISKKGMVVL